MSFKEYFLTLLINLYKTSDYKTIMEVICCFILINYNMINISSLMTSHVNFSILKVIFLTALLIMAFTLTNKVYL